MGALENIWMTIRDYSVEHAAVLLAILSIGIGGALLLYRPAIGELTASRLQAAALLVAVVLIVVALGAAWYANLDTDDGDLTLRTMAVGLKQMPAIYLLVMVGLILLILAYVAGQFDGWRIADLGDMLPVVSVGGLRDVAVVAGTLLLVAAVLYSMTRYLLEGTFSKEYSLIAPFTISGGEDKQRGLALAAALQAKLTDIERDVQTLNEILRSERADREVESGLTQDVVESSSLNVYRKVDLELKFQGVDVGGIFTRALDWFASRRALQVIVAEQDNAAIVSGTLRPDGKSHIYAEIEKATNERIVAAVAYSKLRERLIAEQSNYENLKWGDVEILHNTVVAVADLRGRSEVKMEQFKPHLQKITDLIAKAPKLDRLLMLGAEIAMKAGEVDTAIAFLDRAAASLSDLRDKLDRTRMRLTEPEDAHEEEGEFNALRKEFVRKFNALRIQRQRALSSCALPFVERLRAGEAPATVFNEALAAHKALLRIEPVSGPYVPTVAIVGGVPQRERISYAFETKGEWLVGHSGYDNFADTLGLIVATLAPHAKLLFIPLGTKSRARGSGLTPNEDEIQQAIQEAVKADADIVAVPFPFATKQRMLGIEAVKDKILVVSPAPTKRLQERLSFDLKKASAAFVASVDVDGRFKSGLLSLDEAPISYPGALWVPGTRVPRLGADGMWQATYGSSYATATATAVFANLLGALGKTKPEDSVNRVRSTLRYLDPRNPEIGIVDQIAALAASKPDSVATDRKSICGP